MIRNISENPYRLLGVFVNSSLKTRTAAMARIKAYEKVGKHITTPNDFDSLIGVTVPRGPGAADKAARALELPAERLRNALFWFAESDGYRFHSAAAAGDIAEAQRQLLTASLWENDLNMHTLMLVKGDYVNAARAMDALSSDAVRPLFFDAIGLDNYPCTRADMLNSYFDVIVAVRGDALLDDYAGLWGQNVLIVYLLGKYLPEIKDAMSRAGDIALSGADDACDRAARMLAEAADKYLPTLKRLCDNTAYATLADDVARTIATYTSQAYRLHPEREHASALLHDLNIAAKYAVGEQCRDEVAAEIHKMSVASVSGMPHEGKEDIDNIFALTVFFTGEQTAVSIREFVEKIVCRLGALKEKNLLDHPLVMMRASQAAEKALNAIIVVANDLCLYPSPSPDTIQSIRDIWETFKCIGVLPMDDALRKRYLDNRDNFGTVRDRYAGGNHRNDTQCRTEILSEREYFERCKSAGDYREYLKRYPDGQYRGIAFDRLMSIDRHNSMVSDAIRRATTLAQALTIRPMCDTDDLISLLDNHAWALCDSRKDYAEYLRCFPHGLHCREAVEKTDNSSPAVNFMADHWRILFIIALAVIGLLIYWLAGAMGLKIYFIITGIINFLFFGGFISEGEGCADYLMFGALFLLSFAFAAGI